jgi:hypothetical protein
VSNPYANAVIRLHAYEPSIVTVEEFDAITAELNARRIAGDLQLGDRILAKLLLPHTCRREEIVRGRAELAMIKQNPGGNY